MNIDNQMKIEFLSKSSNESFARATVSAFISQLDPTIEELADIKIAVSEGVTNSIVHGYSDSNGIITISCFIKDNNVKISIKDNGKGIRDITLARQPFYTGAENSERSGMGFTVMETFMDSLEVISEIGRGTEIIMTKEINKSND